MKKLALFAILFGFLLGATTVYAQDATHSAAAGIVIDAPVKVDVNVQPAKASVLVKVQPADVTVTPVNHVNVQPAVNNITVKPADVVVQPAQRWEFEKEPWFWVATVVIVGGIVTAGVCAGGYCGGTHHSTVQFTGQ